MHVLRNNLFNHRSPNLVVKSVYTRNLNTPSIFCSKWHYATEGQWKMIVIINKIPLYHTLVVKSKKQWLISLKCKLGSKEVTPTWERKNWEHPAKYSSLNKKPDQFKDKNFIWCRQSSLSSYNTLCPTWPHVSKIPVTTKINIFCLVVENKTISLLKLLLMSGWKRILQRRKLMHPKFSLVYLHCVSLKHVF